MPASWGSVTRRGARALSYDGPSASEIWTRRDGARDGRAASGYAKPPVLAPNLKSGRSPSSKSSLLPPGVVRERGRSKPVGDHERRRSRLDQAGRQSVLLARRRGPRFPQPAGNAKLEDAARAYSADRYQDALRVLRKLSVQAPHSAAVKELLGLTLYRMGRWPLAVQELMAHHELSGSYDQYPVIVDCFRAMRRYADADAIWEELRQASPSAEVVAEGRLVAAGSLADQGDLSGAVKLLESSLRHSRPKVSHLRQWYARAYFYDRAGELPRAVTSLAKSRR